MNKGTARAIFEDIENAPESIDLKAMAIYIVMNMETHNSVTKDSMLRVIRWLWNQAFKMESR